MSPLSLKFHHLGLAIKRERQAINFLAASGYSIGDQIYDPEQKVNLRICTLAGEPDFELISPAGPDAGPLTSFFQRSNQMIYHVCYEVPDLQTVLEAMEERAMRVIETSPRKPAILFGGRHVSFYMVPGIGLIELLEPL